MNMSLILSVGSWGGFYIHWGFTKRLCLGWFAVTFVPRDDALYWDQSGSDDR